MTELSLYIKQLTHLRRAPNNGGAPHKPVLLLSLLDAFRDGVIQSEVIRISPELIGYFKTNWKTYLESERSHLFVCSFSLPFFHLRGEPFWQLKAQPGYNKTLQSTESISNINTLIKLVDYALMDTQLVELMKNPETAMFLRMAITERYFPKFTGHSTVDYLKQIVNDMETASSDSYRQKMDLLLSTVNEEAEDEKYLRGQMFKREIPRIYNFSCCISGLRVDTPMEVSMIDACHIVPFAESHDDTIGNGMALSPTLHRAFDRGLIAIDDNYRVLTKSQLSEPYQSSYSIKQFAGCSIQLPEIEKHFPNQENLYQHRKRWGFA